MDAYSRALVMFAHAALRSDRRWEAFCFGTRLTRVTRQLEGSDADAALGRAAAHGQLDATALRSRPPEESLTHLQTLPGIGPFSAELILPCYLSG